MRRIFYFIFFFLCVASPVTSFAQQTQPASGPADCSGVEGPFGLGQAACSAGLSGYGNSIPAIVGNVIGAALSLIGIVFFILMLYAGITWMTARGNPEHTKKSMDTMIAASIGLVIVLASYAITSFVLEQVQQSALTTTVQTTPIP